MNGSAGMIEAHKRPYQHAYGIGSSLCALGLAYKAMGLLCFAAGVVAGYFLFQAESGTAIALAPGIAGFVFGSSLFGTGLLIEGIGETLKAVLDTAVNTRVAIDVAGR